MGKHLEYPSQTLTMSRIQEQRVHQQLDMEDCARIVRDATGYHFTMAMYAACEKGVTKNVPLWVVLALLESEEFGLMTTDTIFQEVGAAWR